MRAALTTLTTLASSLEEAHEIAGRLTQAGFARNSIDVDRHGSDGFEVSIHVKEGNRARAERAIDNAWGGLPGLPAQKSSLLMVIGGAAVLGAGLWAFRSMKAAD